MSRWISFLERIEISSIILNVNKIRCWILFFKNINQNCRFDVISDSDALSRSSDKQQQMHRVCIVYELSINYISKTQESLWSVPRAINWTVNWSYLLNQLLRSMTCKRRHGIRLTYGPPPISARSRLITDLYFTQALRNPKI